MYRPRTAGHDPRTTRRRCRPERRNAHCKGGHHGGIADSRRRSHQGGSHHRPDRPALGRSGSRTPTSPGWSSATSTPRAACSGRHLELHLEDSATDDAVAAAKATKLVEHDHVDVILGGIYSSTQAGHQGPGRGRGQDALHLPRAVRGAGVRPAHLLHRPGARAAGRPVHPVADAGDRGEDVLPAVGRLHLAARDERARPGGRHGQRRGDRRRGVLPARPRRLPRRRSTGSPRPAPTSCSTRPCRPGSRRSSSSCTTPASPAAAGTWSARTSRRTS